MKRLGAALGVASLWVKRDDCTGLGVGGNKVRKPEFDLAAALADGARTARWRSPITPGRWRRRRAR